MLPPETRLSPETREKLIELGAEPVRLTGNAPVRLDEETSVWWVEQGKVEIFAYRTDDDATGARTHITTIESGRVVLGVRRESQPQRPFGRRRELEQTAALLGVGLPNTELLKIPLPIFQQLAREPDFAPELATAVDAWVDGLFSKIPKAELPSRFDTLSVGSEVELEEGSAARVDRGVVWIRHVAGASSFIGQEQLAMRTADFLLPISGETWLVAAETTTVSCVGTLNLVRSGGIWEGLLKFHQLFLAYVDMVLAQAQEQERRRLTRRRQMDQALIAGANRKLAAVLEGELDGPSPLNLDDEVRNPLVAACERVGEMQGIRFKAPIEKQKDDQQGHYIGQICHASRVRYRRVMLRDEWWNEDNGPLVGFIWKDGVPNPKNRLRGTPVALLPTSATSYELWNPSTGERKPMDSDLADTLEGEAFMFYTPLPERALKITDLLTLAARGRSGDLRTLLMMGVGTGLLSMLVPLLTGQIFGNIVPAADRSQLFQVTMALVVAAIAAFGFQWVRSIAVLRLSGKLDGSVQAAIWDRLLALPVGFFRGFTVGDLAARSMGMDQIRTLLLGNVTSSFLGAIFSVFSFALLFYYDWRLALIATALVSILLLITGTLVYLQIGHQRQLFAVDGEVTALLFGLLNGLSKLRVAGAEARAYTLWADKFSRQRELTIAAQRLANVQLAFNAMFGLLSSLALFAAMSLWSEIQLEIADFLAFMAAYGQFQGAALSLITLFSSVLTMVPLYERLQPILSTPPEVDDSGVAVTDLTGDVELNHVWFRYQQDGPPILADVSIRARPGELIALVGPSGSGKSTTLRLILGFEQPDSGSVYFDGQDLPSLDIQSVRRRLGVVLQNGRPLSGSIFTNIVGNSNLGIDDAWEAAHMAGLAEDIQAMPMGMHTVISEGAGTFSGGQIQRLMIARAVVHRPRILLFDEATSALDNRTQDIVSQSLERLKVTRIVVAHRLSTIRNADRIYVMDQGRVVEQGTFDELLAADGVFARLAERQIV